MGGTVTDFGPDSQPGPSGAECRAPVELPVLGQGPVRERADAVRNRTKVLAAAERLYRARGVAAVSMNDIAAEAGLGKGTLYRRFADKAALVAALLDERERDLQAALLSGPPPLGPGAPAADRLAAFAAAYLDYVSSHLELVALSQTASPGARLRTGAHRFWRQHCTYLLTTAGAPDPHLRADTLLAALSAEQVRHWTADTGTPATDLQHPVARLARSLTR